MSRERGSVYTVERHVDMLIVFHEGLRNALKAAENLEHSENGRYMMAKHPSELAHHRALIVEMRRRLNLPGVRRAAA